ncbi:MAG: CBS domain-containing protein [Candidatus Altiarchaeales archaeon]|nr:CBS domain-containing protein [Candidatus Altiarchaeales archaeon]MBD3416926.1 CBS domain-containing protein [Candidatus Altiarchaeales archaeon]
MLVTDIMTEDVLRVSPGDNALKTGEHMEANGIGAAVVLEGDAFNGLLSKETFISKIGRHDDKPLESLAVADLMEDDIDCVNSDDTIEEVVELLLMQKSIIDRLPVVEDGKVVGLIGKVNFTGVFHEEMEGKHKVGDLMHYSPVTVYDYTSLPEVVGKIEDMCVKRVLVMSGERLAGIITVKDLSLVLFKHRKENARIDPSSPITAGDMMTPDPVTLKTKDDACDASKLMLDLNIGGIPVLEDRLEGLISRTDLLKGYQIRLSQG